MLEWNVYIENINKREIEVYNIFKYGKLEKEFKNLKKKYKDNREKFEEEIKHQLMYRFWSKCEWEIILSDWPSSNRFNDKKIDVYGQIELNWDRFIDYIWNNL